MWPLLCATTLLHETSCNHRQGLFDFSPQIKAFLLLRFISQQTKVVFHYCYDTAVFFSPENICVLFRTRQRLFFYFSPDNGCLIFLFRHRLVFISLQTRLIGNNCFLFQPTPKLFFYNFSGYSWFLLPQNKNVLISLRQWLFLLRPRQRSRLISVQTMVVFYVTSDNGFFLLLSK